MRNQMNGIDIVNYKVNGWKKMIAESKYELRNLEWVKVNYLEKR